MYHPYYPLHYQPQQPQPQHSPPPPLLNAGGPTSFFGNPLGLVPQHHQQRIHPPPSSSSSAVYHTHPFLTPHYAPTRPLPLANQPRLHPPFLYGYDLAASAPLEGPSSYVPLTGTPPPGPGSSSFNPTVFRPSFYYPLPPTPAITTTTPPPPLTESDVNALGLMRMDEQDEPVHHHHHDEVRADHQPGHQQQQLSQVQEEGEEEISPAMTAEPFPFEVYEPTSAQAPQQEQETDEVQVEAKEEVPDDALAQHEHDGEDEGEGEGGDDDEYAPSTSVKKGKGKAKGKGKKGKGRAKPKGKAKGKGKKKAAGAATGRVGRQQRLTSSSASSMYILPSHTGWDGESDDDILYALRNVQWPLMACTEGSLLEVNDLLILHPPALSPSHKDSHVPTNQYSRNTPVATSAEPGQSMFEMYTCRACRKTYDGKNARSVARRHLQDKHGIPLSKQARRTRWDLDGDRPKDAFEANERSKKCKRDWAKVYRQQRALEKLHADFLLQFGPDGLKTAWKHPLIAPVFREIPPPLIDDNVVWKKSDQVAIPPSIIESVTVLADYESCVEQDKPVPFVGFDDLLHLDEGFECPSKSAYAVQLDPTLSSGSIISTSSSTRPHRPPPHYDPYTSTPGSAESTNSRGQDSQQHGPSPTIQAQSSFAAYIPEQLGPGSVSDQHIFDLLAADAAQMQATDEPPLSADEDGEGEDDEDGPPPLLYEANWQHWSQDMPSVSDSSLARMAAELDRATSDIPLDRTEAGPAVDPVNHDTAAALLDMHYSPPKPARPARPRTAFAQPGWIDNHAQLIAEYSSRPTLTHTKSLSASVKQTFLNRPGHMQRSLSTATLLDDPFVLDQDRAQGTGGPSTNAQSPGRGKARRTGLSSPLSASASARKRQPLSSLYSDANNAANATPQAGSRSFKHDSADKHADSFVTPARPSSLHHHPPPASVDKWLNLSSPADPAASLGLVPTHAVPTTPGLSMIIGQDTPRPLASAAGAKRKRTIAASTPNIR